MAGMVVGMIHGTTLGTVTIRAGVTRIGTILIGIIQIGIIQTGAVAAIGPIGQA